MLLTLKQCPLAVGSRTLAAWVVVVLAVSYSARSSQAGVIVCNEHSIREMAAPHGESSRPQNSGDKGDHRQSPKSLLNSLEAASPSGMDGGMTSTPTAGAPAVAVAYLAHSSVPQSLLVVWLAGGQCPALPALLPSGLFRPPRLIVG